MRERYVCDSSTPRGGSIACKTRHSPWSATRTSRSLPERRFYRLWPNDRASLPAPILFRLPCLCHGRDRVRVLCRGSHLCRIHHGNCHDSRPFNCENKTTRRYAIVRRRDGHDDHTSHRGTPFRGRSAQMRLSSGATVPVHNRKRRRQVGTYLRYERTTSEKKRGTNAGRTARRNVRAQVAFPGAERERSQRDIFLVMLREPSSRAVHCHARWRVNHRYHRVGHTVVVRAKSSSRPHVRLNSSTGCRHSTDGANASNAAAVLLKFFRGQVLRIYPVNV